MNITKEIIEIIIIKEEEEEVDGEEKTFESMERMFN